MAATMHHQASAMECLLHNRRMDRRQCLCMHKWAVPESSIHLCHLHRPDCLRDRHLVWEVMAALLVAISSKHHLDLRRLGLHRTRLLVSSSSHLMVMGCRLDLGDEERNELWSTSIVKQVTGPTKGSQHRSCNAKLGSSTAMSVSEGTGRETNWTRRAIRFT